MNIKEIGMRIIQRNRNVNLKQKRRSCQLSRLVFPNYLRHLGFYVGLCFMFTSASCVNQSSKPSQDHLVQNQVPWPTIAWSEANPEVVGMDGKALKEAEEIYPRLFPSNYSLLIIRNGQLVSESYFLGQTVETSNHIYSITKTFVATLLGIAVKQRWIDNVQQRVADLLPEHLVNPKLAELTLEDVLTHRSGVRNDGKLADINLLLKEEPKTPPGTAYAYSNFAPHLITAILDRQAKQGITGDASDVTALAEEHLFGPLGIRVTQWNKGPQGVPEGANGLHMTARDLARLGYLLQQEGRWEEKQLLPIGWVQAATKHRVEVDRQKGYGYLNWVRRRSDNVQTASGDRDVQGYFAYGHRGQFIGVYPELDLLVVTTADATDATRDTFFVPDLLHDFVRRFVFPAVIQ